MRSLSSRGFLHGFLLPLVWLLPVHGLFFALHRSHLDKILRGHWGDGVRWVGEPNGTWLGIAVGSILVVLVLADGLRRWIGSWRRDDGPSMDLFWVGMLGGVSTYICLRQVGSAMQDWNVGLGWVLGVRMFFFGMIAIEAMRAGVRAVFPGASWVRWGRGLAYVALLGMSIGVVRFQLDLLTWNLERVALRTNDAKDYDRWLFRTGDSSEQERIRQLGWSRVRHSERLDELAWLRDRKENWGRFADSAGVEWSRRFHERALAASSRRLSLDPEVDRIWRDWAKEAADSGRPRTVKVALDWERVRLHRFLDSLRRKGGLRQSADRVLPLYGDEATLIDISLSRIDSTVGNGAFQHDFGQWEQGGDIRLTLDPFLAANVPSGRIPVVGYRWTIVLGAGRVDSVVSVFTSCDTAKKIGFDGKCPVGGSYDLDSLHFHRQGNLRWNDLGTRKPRMLAFLRSLWRIEQ